MHTCAQDGDGASADDKDALTQSELQELSDDAQERLRLALEENDIDISKPDKVEARGFDVRSLSIGRAPALWNADLEAFDVSVKAYMGWRRFEYVLNSKDNGGGRFGIRISFSTIRQLGVQRRHKSCKVVLALYVSPTVWIWDAEAGVNGKWVPCEHQSMPENLAAAVQASSGALHIWDLADNTDMDELVDQWTRGSVQLKTLLEPAAQLHHTAHSRVAYQPLEYADHCRDTEAMKFAVTTDSASTLVAAEEEEKRILDEKTLYERICCFCGLEVTAHTQVLHGICQQALREQQLAASQAGVVSSRKRNASANIPEHPWPSHRARAPCTAPTLPYHTRGLSLSDKSICWHALCWSSVPGAGVHSAGGGSRAGGSQKRSARGADGGAISSAPQTDYSALKPLVRASGKAWADVKDTKVGQDAIKAVQETQTNIDSGVEVTTKNVKDAWNRELKKLEQQVSDS